MGCGGLSETRRAATIGLTLAIVCVVLLVFWPTLGNEFVNWDDDLNLTGNRHYRGLSTDHLRWMFTVLHGGHYQPLTWVTYAVDHELWGLDPFGYHLTNLVLHAATAVAFFVLVLALTRRAGVEVGTAPAAALVAALFFAIHPLRVESVAWASERRDVLSGLFFVLTLVAYLRMLEADRGRWRWYALSLACFAGSLLAKAWAITLPALLLVLDAHPLGRLGPDTRGRVLVEKVPYALLAGAAAALALLAQQVEAMRTLSQHGVVGRVMQAAYGLCFYPWRTVWPTSLSPLYLLELPIDSTEARYWGALVAVVAVTAGLVVLRRRWPWALAAWACYAITISPVLGFVQSGQQKVADRYTYLACLSFAVLAGVVGGRLVARSRAGLLAVAVVLAALGVTTQRQTRVWHDSRTLWDHALALDPENYFAYVNRGTVRQSAGDVDGALADYEAAIRWNPGHAEAWNNRGIVRAERGDLAGARADYDRALRLKPTYADAHMNRAVVRERAGDVAAAIADYTAAIALDPEHARAHYGRGNLRQIAGDLRGAVEDYTAALAHDPDYVEAWNNRGLARRALGDAAGAAADFRRALALAPRDWPDRARIERNLAAVGAGG